MVKLIDFVELLSRTQQFISTNYSKALTDADKQVQIKSYINKFLQDNDYEVRGMDFEEVSDRLFREMVEYSVLTPYLSRDDVEEINVNSWDDVAVTFTNGKTEKLYEHFYSPQHAIDIVKRLLQSSGMIIDNAAPMAQGHLPGNTRVTALKDPLVDEDVGIAVSIRLLHPSRITRDMLIRTGTATDKIVDFLETCLRYGVSLVVAGATSSGKTTMLNALLNSIPNDKRIFTIETGARELSLVKRDEEGRVINNVVHTLSRPSDNETYDINQEQLVVASLRFDPNLVVVGEMRDMEASAAVEASLTGHTVASTVHAYGADSAHMRIALLCQRRHKIDFNTSLMQAGQAFPIVVYSHKLEDNSRKLMDISECEVTSSGERIYHTLYRYCITKNELVGDKYQIEGHFEQVEVMSEALQRRLLQFGVPQKKLEGFLTKGAEY